MGAIDSEKRYYRRRESRRSETIKDYLTVDQSSFELIRMRGKPADIARTQVQGGYFKVVPPDEAAWRIWAINTPTIGEVLEWLESSTLILNSPAVSLPWIGCMLQREDGQRGNWENVSRHRMLTHYIDPCERDFSATFTPWKVLWTSGNAIYFTCRTQ
jgi:hypothetical protein